MTKSDLEKRIESRRTFIEHDQEAELWIFEAQIFDALREDRVFPWRPRTPGEVSCLPSAYRHQFIIHWITHLFLLLSTLGCESRGLDRSRQF